MQWNQPFGNYGLQGYPKRVSPAIPQIVGEGDVTAVTFPDGSVQFYFVPSFRQNLSPCPVTIKNPYGSLFSCPTNTEVWFVRSITNPQPNLNISVPPGYFNNQLANTFGDCPPYSPPNYCMTTNPPTYHEYTQKFHNDRWTSTTDIHYFYPSLRRAKYLQYCTETQTEPSQQNNNIGQNGGLNRPCLRGQNSGTKEQKTFNTESDCHPKVQIKSSHSCMSVDSESESEKWKNKKYKKTSAKNKNTSKRDHICKCNQDRKGTSNKLVTTYADQATENVAKDGRAIQTDSSKSTNKSDIKVEKCKPKKQNSRTSKKKPIKLSSSSESCCYCDYCTCRYFENRPAQ